MPRKASDLIARLAQEEAALRGQLLLSPLVRGGQARTRLNGLVYQFRVPNAEPGWWCCRVQDAHTATIESEAQPWQRGDYLRLWPALRLVLLEPLRDSDWLAIPFNAAEAQQRFGISGPQVVHLVEGGQPFERIVARCEAQTLWYDAPDRRADPRIAEALRDALAERQPAPAVAGLGQGERAAYALLLGIDTTRTLDEKLRAALTIGGAQLLGYEQVGEQLRVIWQRGTLRHVTLIDQSLTVISAGICLGGEDQRFDLASIVGVVLDAPDYARYNDPYADW
jgi:hypothetical protein